MADFEGVKITGLEELAARMNKLAEDMERKHSLKAAKHGADVILAEQQRLVPKDKGDLHDSLVLKRIPKSQGILGYKIGADKKMPGARVAHIVEFGAAAHKVIVSHAGFLGNFRSFFGKEVDVPAQPPRSFIRASADNKAMDAIMTVSTRLFQIIRKEYGG